MYKKYIKRSIDAIVAAIVLILLSPLYLIISIAIRVIDGDPIIYKQYRTGQYGKKFQIYKFRTMKDGKTTKLR